MKLKLKRNGPNKRYRFKGYKTVQQASRVRFFERQRQTFYQYALLVVAGIAALILLLAVKPWDKIRDILTIFGLL